MLAIEPTGAGAPPLVPEPWQSRLDRLRRDPDAAGRDWLLLLVPALAEAIDSAEWYGPPVVLARFLAANFGPLPSALAVTADLIAALREAAPTLAARGYAVTFLADPSLGEVVHIDGTSGLGPAGGDLVLHE